MDTFGNRKIYLLLLNLQDSFGFFGLCGEPTGIVEVPRQPLDGLRVPVHLVLYDDANPGELTSFRPSGTCPPCREMNDVQGTKVPRQLFGTPLQLQDQISRPTLRGLVISIGLVLAVAQDSKKSDPFRVACKDWLSHDIVTTFGKLNEYEYIPTQSIALRLHLVDDSSVCYGPGRRRFEYPRRHHHRPSSCSCTADREPVCERGTPLQLRRRHDSRRRRS